MPKDKKKIDGYKLGTKIANETQIWAGSYCPRCKEQLWVTIIHYCEDLFSLPDIY